MPNTSYCCHHPGENLRGKALENMTITYWKIRTGAALSKGAFPLSSNSDDASHL